MAEHRTTAGIEATETAYRADTATIGMWLFLTSEVLFFGVLIFTYLIYGNLYPTAMAAGVRHTDLAIGTINTVILATSSLVIAVGAAGARTGDVRRLILALAVTAGLGVAFLVLKGIEYHLDFQQHLFPGAAFGPAGAEADRQQIFFSFYFIATAVHAAHMVVGLGFIGNVLRRAIRGDFPPAETAPVQVAALYWSFVDIVWICLFPLLYLVGRG